MGDFESRKNLQAGTITGVIVGLLLLSLFIISWSIPRIEPVMTEEGMEVNLGNSDDGSGEIQPLVPGPPAAEDREETVPPKNTPAPVEEAREVETNDNDAEAPDVKVAKPNKPTPKSITIPIKENTAPAKKPAVKPAIVENPTPAPPRPKAAYKGGDGTGPGGNDADSYNNSRSQGNTAGRSDRGLPGGDPDSRNYEGTGGRGTGGSGISLGGGLRGRRIVRTPSFTDDFNENAKVAVDVTVDAAGNVTAASYQPRGSTTSDAGLKAIALRKAQQVKFAAGSETRGTILFNFRVTN